MTTKEQTNEQTTTDQTEGGGAAESQLSIPEKFRNADGSANVEAMLKSYRELETKFSGGGKGTAEDEPRADGASTSKDEPKAEAKAPANELEIDTSAAEDDTAEDDGKGTAEDDDEEETQGEILGETQEEITAKLTSLGLPADELIETFVRDGSLTPRQLAALEAKGITQADITATAANYTSRVETVKGTLVEAFTSAEQLAEFQQWSRHGLSLQEQHAFNEAVRTLDPTKVLNHLARSGVVNRFERSNSRVPARVGGTEEAPRQNAEAAPFDSWEEQIAAQKDPRYAKDKSFRDMVAKRIKAGMAGYRNAGAETYRTTRSF